MMSGLTLRAVLLAALCFVPQFAAAQGLGGLGSLPTNQLLSRYGLERAWWSQAAVNSARDKVAHLVADEDAVYVQSTGGMITAFELQTGRRMWAQQLGRADHPAFPILSTDVEVIVAIGMNMYGLRKSGGQLLWEIRLPGYPSATPSTDGVRLYIPMMDGGVYAYDIATIQSLYQESLLPQWSYEAQVWRYKTSNRIISSPITTGTAVAFTSLNGSLYTVTADRREIIFQMETDDPASAPLAYANGLLYMPTASQRVYCINLVNGQVRWEYITGTPVQSKPVVIGDDLYLTPLRGGMFNLSAATGKEQWWRPRITEFLARTPKILHVSDDAGNVLVLDRHTGVTLGVLPVRNFNIRFKNERTDRLIMATETGTVVCIRERGRDYPLYHMFPEARPIIPEFAPETPEPPAPQLDPAAPVDPAAPAVE